MNPILIIDSHDAQRGTLLSARDWLPVLYGALHFVQNAEEPVIRNNAAFTLCRFVSIVASDALSVAEAEPLLIRTAFPALKNALRLKTKLVRTDFLGVIAHAALKCGRIASLRLPGDTAPLLAGGDDEANFFTNVQTGENISTARRTMRARILARRYAGRGIPPPAGPPFILWLFT